MAAISGYDSSSLGVLFSSLNTGAAKNSFYGGAAFGGSDLLGINYSDYASIRSGSYFKLLNAYYQDTGNLDAVKPKPSTSVSRDDAKTLARIESAADDMKDSAAALQANGTKSLFKEVTVKGEDGKETTGYDTDAIYKAVKKFADDYNSLLDTASESDTTSILRAAKNMTNYTKINERLLSKAGITIGSDNKLTVDEEAFKKSDMRNVRDLFQTRGSYGYQIMTQASMIDAHAKTEAAKANTYGKTGMYTYNYNTGELYNSGI